MSVLSVLGRKSLAIAIVTALFVGTIGAAALGLVGSPSVVGVENTFGPVTAEETTVESDLIVENPNPIGLGSGDLTLEYGIRMNEISMASGSREGLGLERGTTITEFETSLENERIPEWWVSHVEAGERTTLSIHADVYSSRLDRSAGTPTVEREIETDLIGSFDSTEPRPVEADSPLLSDPVAYVNETSAEWGEVRDGATPIEMGFLVYNPQAYPIVVSELGYEITMNEVTVGEGAVEETHVIGSEETEEVDLLTEMKTESLDEWWVSHLDGERNGHQVSELRIEFYAVIDLSALGGGEVTVPLDTLTYEETVETDIFDEGLSHGSDDGGGDDGREVTSEDGDDDRADDERGDDSASEERTGDDGQTGEGSDEGATGEDEIDDGVLPL
ncbi:LEA type 2 family protein [Natronorarus salvus]|uniref:LEA type 2 family protein n=1 Tax=Natronorarus salvus TaxID=3117733 RepID=UPI002F25F8EE